jgi:uncharacterized protein
MKVKRTVVTHASRFAIYRRYIKQSLMLLLLLLLSFSAWLWYGSEQLLFPVAKGVSKNLTVCKEETADSWGVNCGNLRVTHEFQFDEIDVPSINGYKLPGWLITTFKNGRGATRAAIMLIHGGGADRREETRFIRFFLDRHMDVLTVDLGCHGEAPCPVSGLTYGERESRDVLSVYLFLSARFDEIYAMGTSVGAASILISLPAMPKIVAVIAENPMVDFQRFTADAVESRSLPGWFAPALTWLTMTRGRFDGLLSPKNSLRFVNTTPIFFVHSKSDRVISYRRTEDLADNYKGPKTVWLPEIGDHASIWETNHDEYEKRLSLFLNTAR